MNTKIINEERILERKDIMMAICKLKFVSGFGLSGSSFMLMCEATRPRVFIVTLYNAAGFHDRRIYKKRGRGSQVSSLKFGIFTVFRIDFLERVNTPSFRG
jgi:hypothetical protein